MRGCRRRGREKRGGRKERGETFGEKGRERKEETFARVKKGGGRGGGVG